MTLLGGMNLTAWRKHRPEVVKDLAHHRLLTQVVQSTELTAGLVHQLRASQKTTLSRDYVPIESRATRRMGCIQASRRIAPVKRRSRRFWGIPAVRVAGKSPLGDSKTAPQADGSIARSPARWTTAQVSKSSARTNDIAGVMWQSAPCTVWPTEMSARLLPLTIYT